MSATFLCRPCRKTYSADEMQGRRACPKCRGPLVSQQQLDGYKADTQASLSRLKHQSSSTLAGGALLAMGIQTVINIIKHDPDFSALTFMVFVGGILGLVTAGLWWYTSRPSLMLVASLVFQVTSFVYFFSVFAASGTLDILESKWGVRITFAVALAPFCIALFAWHQYRSYLRILKPR
ncbi:hypothetical protein [Verrucomicrobium sp. BvORR106]|uniref:hypothetical protein n=1 Tax=Verrucomicrobium sp. BvORR106 TaxID=1403819 RepID=UPI00056EC912|nr:hypothetical protein [Verrucomicrobium sp. BvORR106]